MTGFKRSSIRIPVITPVLVIRENDAKPLEMTVRDVSTLGVFLERPLFDKSFDLRIGDLVYIKVQEVEDSLPREMKVMRKTHDGWGLEFVR